LRDDPPPQLVNLLDRLGLASGWDFRRVRARVRRLARDLPLFESVWIDALQQAGTLTPLQAAELNAGRGEQLGVGPLVLAQKTDSHGYANSYRGREILTRQPVRITLTSLAGHDADVCWPESGRLESLVQRLAGAEIPGIAAIERFGIERGQLWTSSRWFAGRSARDWLIRHGRFSPDQVLEIARQMAAALAALEQAGVLHTDISASRLLLTTEGQAVLTEPGLRALVRPAEGYAHADLQPEAFDYLAPERVGESRPPSAASDLYACGALWWHLLTGRSPLGGGNSLTKLRAAQRAKIADVRRLTVEVPQPLTAAIAQCLARDPAARPASFAALADALGTPSASRRQSLARAVRTRPTTPRLISTESPRAASPARLWMATATAALVLAAATRPWWPLVTDSMTGGSASAKSLERPRRVIAQAEKTEPKKIEADPPANVATPDVAPLPPKAAPANPPAKMPVLRRPEKSLSSKRSDPQGVEKQSDKSAPAVAPVGPPPWKIAPDGALVLSTKEPIDAARLAQGLKAGQMVRGTVVAGAAGEKRPRVTIGDAGLRVAVEGVAFEGIDFVWQGTTVPQFERDRPSGMIRLAAYKATFRGCSFTTTSSEGTPAAILWTGPRASAIEVSLPTGQLSLSRCYLRGVGATIDSRLHAAVVVEIDGSLLVETGPLLRTDHWPVADEPLAISLSKSTLRDSGGLIECRFEPVPSAPGRISLETRDGAFSPAKRQPLVTLVGSESPGKLLGQLAWTGEGSVVAPDVPVAAWRDGSGRTHTAREEQVRVENLLRGALGFEGPLDDGPAASRVIRWQAPRRSPDAPGIGDEPLLGP